MISSARLIFYIDSSSDSIDHFVFDAIFIYNRHFLLYKRADLTVSASLQWVCGEISQLHPLCLTSTATSTRELSRIGRDCRIV